MWDGLQEIFYSLRQNKLRTAITGFGVFWGIFMLIAMLGFGQGMRNGVESGFGNMARDNIFFAGGPTKIAYKGTAVDTKIDLTLEDVEQIKNNISGIRAIAVENQLFNTFVSHEKLSGTFATVGVGEDYFKIKDKMPFLLGRKI